MTAQFSRCGSSTLSPLESRYPNDKQAYDFPYRFFDTVGERSAGLGSGFFGATQSTLVMTAVPEEIRGRALGLLSMAIGALPIGMYLLGEVAEIAGARNALIISALTGMAVLFVWVRRRPEIAALTS